MADFQMVLAERERMCDSFLGCMRCPLAKAQKEFVSCKNWTVENPAEAERIIMQWSKEHPVMTNAMKFKEVFGYDFQDAFGALGCSEWLDDEYEKGKRYE